MPLSCGVGDAPLSAGLWRNCTTWRGAAMMCLSSNRQGNDHFGPPCCGVGALAEHFDEPDQQHRPCWRFAKRAEVRTSGWSSLTTPWGFPCFVRFPCVHAAATTPAQRLNVSLRSFHPDVSVFPDRVVGSTCALSFSRIARRSLALRPAHSRCHQFVTR